MHIQEFSAIWGSDHLGTSSHIYDRWEREKRVDELLNSPVAPGIVLFDLLSNDQFLDQINSELVEAFGSLSKDRFVSVAEVREKLIEMTKRGDDSVVGFVNKITGQIGENRFMEESIKNGIRARLAESGNQLGWDIVRQKGGGESEYIQVKFSNDPDYVIKSIEETQTRLDHGMVKDGEQIVESVNFAVSENIYEDVRTEVLNRGYDLELYRVELPNEEARDLVETGFGFTLYTEEAVENLFSELFGSIATAGAIHLLTNGFLMYKGAKNVREFWNDTVDNTAISSGALTMGMVAEIFLTNVIRSGGLPLYVAVAGTTYVTRQVLKRLVNRQSYVDWLREQNKELNVLIESFS